MCPQPQFGLTAGAGPLAARQSPPRLLELLLPLAALLLLLPGAVHGGLPCERSGYCSLGKTKPYLGEVETALGLRAALASRSYKREVILMASDSERMLHAMQAVGNLLRLGLEHVMMVSNSGPDCVRVASAVPTAGCVWLEFELPIFGAEREFVVPAIPMWHNRYRLAARIVRMRYNVFLVDTDVIFFDDPYVYFKSPPFANFTIINQPEVLYDQVDYTSETEPNGGVLYVQNAAPDGPAAWLLSEVTDRLLRWVEDGFNLTRHTHSLVSWCNYMDQDGLRDAITSVRLGRVFFGAAMRDCRLGEWMGTHGSQHDAIMVAIDNALMANGSDFISSFVPLPPALQPVAGANTTFMRHFIMRMPAYAPWDERYGPYLYPPTRGVLSRQWIKELKDDCDCPLWPDPEDPSAAAAAVAMPPEHYLLAPPFLMLNWFARGRMGYWHRALTPGGPQQVVGHLHYVPGTGAALGKTVAKMAVGHYDWVLARQALGPRLYFMHQGGHAIQPGPQSQPGGHSPMYLLALHPSFAGALATTASWREYSELLSGLAMTAFALKRVPVWPDVPCSAQWVTEDGPEGASSLPLRTRQEFIPYGKRRTQMFCVWLALLNEACLFNGRGMLSLEFAHWRNQMRLLPSLDPGEHNTIGLLSAELGPSTPAANVTPSGRIFNVPMDEVSRTWALRRTHTHRVLYLLNPLNVTFPANTEDTYAVVQSLSECKATNTPEMELDLIDKPYKSPAAPTINFVPAAVGPDGLIRSAPAIPGYNVAGPQPEGELGAEGVSEGGGTDTGAAAAGTGVGGAASGAGTAAVGTTADPAAAAAKAAAQSAIALLNSQGLSGLGGLHAGASGDLAARRKRKRRPPSVPLGVTAGSNAATTTGTAATATTSPTTSADAGAASGRAGVAGTLPAGQAATSTTASTTASAAGAAAYGTAAAAGNASLNNAVSTATGAVASAAAAAGAVVAGAAIVGTDGSTPISSANATATAVWGNVTATAVWGNGTAAAAEGNATAAAAEGNATAAAAEGNATGTTAASSVAAAAAVSANTASDAVTTPLLNPAATTTTTATATAGPGSTLLALSTQGGAAAAEAAAAAGLRATAGTALLAAGPISTATAAIGQDASSASGAASGTGYGNELGVTIVGGGTLEAGGATGGAAAAAAAAATATATAAAGAVDSGTGAGTLGVTSATVLAAGALGGGLQSGSDFAAGGLGGGGLDAFDGGDGLGGGGGAGMGAGMARVRLGGGGGGGGGGGRFRGGAVEAGQRIAGRLRRNRNHGGGAHGGLGGLGGLGGGGFGGLGVGDLGGGLPGGGGGQLPGEAHLATGLGAQDSGVMGAGRHLLLAEVQMGVEAAGEGGLLIDGAAGQRRQQRRQA